MSKKVWIRTRLQGKNEVIIMRKRFGWPISWRASYYDYASVNSGCNKLEADIVATIQKLRKQISTFVQADSARKEDVKFAERSSLNRFGVSDSILITMGDLKAYGEYHPKPDEKIYRDALNPRWLAQNGLGKSSKTRKGSDLPNVRGTRSAYIATDKNTLDQHRVEIVGDDDVDNATDYKESGGKKKGSKNGKKSWKSQFRKDNPYDEDDHGTHKSYEALIEEEWEEHNS